MMIKATKTTAAAASTIYTVNLRAKRIRSSVIITQCGRFYYPYSIEEGNEDKERLYDKANKGELRSKNISFCLQSHVLKYK